MKISFSVCYSFVVAIVLSIKNTAVTVGTRFCKLSRFQSKTSQNFSRFLEPQTPNSWSTADIQAKATPDKSITLTEVDGIHPKSCVG